MMEQRENSKVELLSLDVIREFPGSSCEVKIIFSLSLSSQVQLVYKDY